MNHKSLHNYTSEVLFYLIASILVLALLFTSTAAAQGTDTNSKEGCPAVTELTASEPTRTPYTLTVNWVNQDSVVIATTKYNRDDHTIPFAIDNDNGIIIVNACHNDHYTLIHGLSVEYVAEYNTAMPAVDYSSPTLIYSYFATYGQGSIAYLVYDAMSVQISQVEIERVNGEYASGEIVDFTGTPEQYDEIASWQDEISAELNAGNSRIFLPLITN